MLSVPVCDTRIHPRIHIQTYFRIFEEILEFISKEYNENVLYKSGGDGRAIGDDWLRNSRCVHSGSSGSISNKHSWISYTGYYIPNIIWVAGSRIAILYNSHRLDTYSCILSDIDRSFTVSQLHSTRLLNMPMLLYLTYLCI